jgi:hypothetical protein
MLSGIYSRQNAVFWYVLEESEAVSQNLNLGPVSCLSESPEKGHFISKVSVCWVPPLPPLEDPGAKYFLCCLHFPRFPRFFKGLQEITKCNAEGGKRAIERVIISEPDEATAGPVGPWGPEAEIWAPGVFGTRRQRGRSSCDSAQFRGKIPNC